MSPELRDRFMQFARNGRWGTCASCPRVLGDALPELCEHTDRYDHQLTLEGLVEQYRRACPLAAAPSEPVCKACGRAAMALVRRIADHSRGVGRQMEVREALCSFEAEAQCIVDDPHAATPKPAAPSEPVCAKCRGSRRGCSMCERTEAGFHFGMSCDNKGDEPCPACVPKPAEPDAIRAARVEALRRAADAFCDMLRPNMSPATVAAELRRMADEVGR